MENSIIDARISHREPELDRVGLEGFDQLLVGLGGVMLDTVLVEV